MSKTGKSIETDYWWHETEKWDSRGLEWGVLAHRYGAALRDDEDLKTECVDGCITVNAQSSSEPYALNG